MIKYEHKIANEIIELSNKYASKLKAKIDSIILEMEVDDDSHYLIYKVLGISVQEGKQIDIYQNKGPFLYKYAGSFLEEAAKLCFKEKFEAAKAVRITNTIGIKPKTFEIDCLIEDKDAIEIKWRDATTDGDHITKEHTRIKNIFDAGYKPIRVMFYYPNRAQAIKIQKTLETLYKGIGGEYYYGEDAWDFILNYTHVNLKGILESIVKTRDLL